MKIYKSRTIIAVAGLAAALSLGVAGCGSTSTTGSESDSASSSGAASATAAEQETTNAVTPTLEEVTADLAIEADVAGLSADEMYQQGRQYEKGDGVVQWYSMAKAYYEAALDADSDQARAALNDLDAYRDEVLSESEDAQGTLFELYRAGVTAGQDGDYETAYASAYDDVFFFEDPEYRGLGSMADLLRDGLGVDQNVEEAIKIYTLMAVTLGKGNGFTALGLLYSAEEGTYPGVEHSDEQALEYFLKSYQEEDLVETDFKGPRYAGDLYDSGYDLDDGTHVDPDYAKAAESYRLAADGNERTFDGTSCYKLGVYYEEGRDGIEQDYKKAAEYYLKAVSDENVQATMQGIPQTYLSLGRFYENGLGVEENLETAKDYYRQALDAAQQNLDLRDVASNQDAQTVYDEASEALERLQ